MVRWRLEDLRKRAGLLGDVDQLDEQRREEFAVGAEGRGDVLSRLDLEGNVVESPLELPVRGLLGDRDERFAMSTPAISIWAKRAGGKRQ